MDFLSINSRVPTQKYQASKLSHGTSLHFSQRQGQAVRKSFLEATKLAKVTFQDAGGKDPYQASYGIIMLQFL